MKVVGYVFDGPSGNCHVLQYDMRTVSSLTEIIMLRDELARDYPGKSIVICDQKPTVRDAYLEAKRRGSFAAWLECYDYLSKVGIAL